MKKKILSTLLAGAAIATMGVATAQASALDAVAGDIKFTYDGFDAAQTFYDFSSVSATGVLCDNSVAGDECNNASNLLGSSAATGANGSDDTWGVTSIIAISTNPPFPASGNSLWGEGDDGEYLLTYFHGFEDILVTVGPTGVVQTYSEFGTVDIYRVDQATRDAAFAAADQNALEALLPAIKYLELSFNTGCSAGVAGATLCGTYDGDDFRGSSEGQAIAIGGTAMAKYPEVFEFEHSIEPCNPDFSVCGAGSSYNVVIDSGSATTTALPEPGALGLMGLGLVGLGLIGRRRKA